MIPNPPSDGFSLRQSRRRDVERWGLTSVGRRWRKTTRTTLKDEEESTSAKRNLEKGRFRSGAETEKCLLECW